MVFNDIIQLLDFFLIEPNSGGASRGVAARNRDW